MLSVAPRCAGFQAESRGLSSAVCGSSGSEQGGRPGGQPGAGCRAAHAVPAAGQRDAAGAAAPSGPHSPGESPWRCAAAQLRMGRILRGTKGLTQAYHSSTPHPAEVASSCWTLAMSHSQTVGDWSIC